MAAMITVVAALIEREGRLLICQRRRDAAFPLQWEFPGGKVHAGETPQAALARELQEELGVSAQIGREIYRTRHSYAELRDEIELIFYSAALPPHAAVTNLAFESIEWRPAGRLPSYDFLPADRELIVKLASRELTTSLTPETRK
ncbi:MAG: (deoxy)nucleoside triphosphate pyrophosphohydrolase [Candidatus Acidiferrales bacterium]